MVYDFNNSKWRCIVKRQGVMYVAEKSMQNQMSTCAKVRAVGHLRSRMQRGDKQFLISSKRNMNLCILRILKHNQRW